MKRYPAIVTLVLCAWCGSAAAHQYGNSSVQVLRPSELSAQKSHKPGSPHGHVRQRLAYGKGYRYGHRADGKLGDITIWSPEPYKAYSSSPSKKSTRPRRPRSESLAGPELQYRPNYGKAAKPDYGQ